MKRAMRDAQKISARFAVLRVAVSADGAAAEMLSVMVHWQVRRCIVRQGTGRLDFVRRRLVNIVFLSLFLSFLGYLASPSAAAQKVLIALRLDSRWR